MNKDDLIAMLLSVIVMIPVIVVMWVCIGIYGISEGSNDLCTRSFKEAVECVCRAICEKMQ